MNETETQAKLRKATEALKIAREKESTTRMAWNRATQEAKLAKDRYEEIFQQEEQEERARRIKEYHHATK